MKVYLIFRIINGRGRFRHATRTMEGAQAYVDSCEGVEDVDGCDGEYQIVSRPLEELPPVTQLAIDRIIKKEDAE
jgi:hypothetical protein